MTRTRTAGCLLLLAVAMMSGCDALVSPEERLARANEALAEGDWNRASIELRKALVKSPEDVPARLLLARVALHNGDLDGASREIGTARAHGAEASVLSALSVDLRLARGEADELLADLEGGKLTLPEPDKSIARGRAYLQVARPGEAQAAFEAALAQDASSQAARLGAAQALAALGRIDAALEALDALLRAAPTNAEALSFKGEILLRRGEPEAAGRAFDEAARQMTALPLSKQQVIVGGGVRAALAHGDIPGAEQRYAALRGLAGDTPFALMLGAQLALGKGDYTKGIADLQRVVRMLPDVAYARMMLGAAQLSRGNLQQAESELAAVVRAAPDNLEARKLLARARIQLNRPDAALEVLSPALGTDAVDPQIHELMSAAQLKAGDRARALQTLEQSVNSPARTPQLELELAAAYLASGRNQDALKLLRALPPERGGVRRDALLIAAATAQGGPGMGRAEVTAALRERPRDVQLLNLAAAYFTAQRDFERARTLVHQAIEIDPENHQTWMSLARVDLAASDAAGAEEALRRSLALAQDDPVARIALAQVIADRGDRAGAVKLLEDPGPSGKRHPQVMLALAELHYAAGALPAAREALEEAIAAAPQHAGVAVQAGNVLMEAQQFELALTQFRRAVLIDPANADAWLSMGRAQLALNDPVTARDSITKSLELRPDSTAALGALTLIDVRGKRFDAALQRIHEQRQQRRDDVALVSLEADVLFAQRRYAEADKLLGEALKMRPSRSTAIRSFQSRRAGALKAPEVPLEDWLAQHPEDDQVRLVLASHYTDTNQHRKAIGQLEKLSPRARANWVVLNNLAVLYQRVGDPRAAGVAEEAYRLASDKAAVADTLGWILALQGDLHRAVPLLETASRGLPESQDAQYHYAYALAQAGKQAQARAVLAPLLAQPAAFAERGNAEQLMRTLSP